MKLKKTKNQVINYYFIFKNSGKTLIARAIANFIGSNFILIDGYRIGSKSPEIGLELWECALQEAREKKPAIVFIRYLPIIAGLEGANLNAAHYQVLCTFFTLIKEMIKSSKVIIHWRG